MTFEEVAELNDSLLQAFLERLYDMNLIPLSVDICDNCISILLLGHKCKPLIIYYNGEVSCDSPRILNAVKALGSFE